jgi:serine/threonine protein phosphatase 1
VVGRCLIIGDIHGCSATFKELLNKAGLTTDDKLILLGDYIDRGHDSSGVIDFIIELQSKGYDIVPLRGNHEENLLNALEEYPPEVFKHFVDKINKSSDLLDSEGRLQDKYLNFIKDLPYFYESESYFIVHAGLNFKTDDPLSDTVSMLEIRDFAGNADISVIGSKRIIHGHQPVTFNEIEKAITDGADVIPLDNGCVYTKPHKVYDYKQLGNLCCFDATNENLIFQKNIEKE